MDICFFLFHNNIRQLRDVCIFEVNGMDMYKPILDVLIFCVAHKKIH